MTSPKMPRSRGSVDDHSVFDDARTYYSDERHAHNRAGARTRTFSQNSLIKQMERIGVKEPFRRGSHGKPTFFFFSIGAIGSNRCVPDESNLRQPRRFLIQVEATLESLQSQEDTDGDMQITIEDNGPKVRTQFIVQDKL